MPFRRLSGIKIYLLIILCIYSFFGIIYSSFAENNSFFEFFFVWSIINLLFGILMSTLFIINSIQKRKKDLFCFYVIPIIIVCIIFVFTLKNTYNKWDTEMFRIAGILENYYSENGVVELNKNDLNNLGIFEDVYITINKNGYYYIVNKKKDMVYRSDLKKIVEEDNDY